LNRFKYIFVLLITAVSIINKSSAQETEFGLIGGLNVSDLGNIPVGFGITTSSNTGFHLGAFVNIPLSFRFDFQPQFLYSQLGSSLTSVGYDSTLTITQVNNITLSYIVIPLNFCYKFKGGWNIHAGPYISFLLSDKEYITQTVSQYGSTVNGGDTTTNTTQGDNKFDLGFSLGIGYTMQNGLGFNFSYSTGLINVAQQQTYTDPSSGQTYTQPAFGLNNWYSFSISYLFR